MSKKIVSKINKKIVFPQKIHKYLKSSGLDSVLVASSVLPMFYLFIYFISNLGLYLRSLGVIQ